MARTFKRARTAQPIAELNVTNLIDLGFTLLIIFMIATPLIQQEQTIPVNLPEVTQAPQVKPDPNEKTETVTIKADGSLIVGEQTVSFAGLTRELRNFAAREPKPVIHLRMDSKSTADQYIKVFNELEKFNLRRWSYDTKIADK